MEKYPGAGGALKGDFPSRKDRKPHETNKRCVCITQKLFFISTRFLPA